SPECSLVSPNGGWSVLALGSGVVAVTWQVPNVPDSAWGNPACEPLDEWRTAAREGLRHALAAMAAAKYETLAADSQGRPLAWVCGRFDLHLEHVGTLLRWLNDIHRSGVCMPNGQWGEFVGR